MSNTKNPTASGECEVETSAEDRQKNVDANAKYDAENTAAREAKYTAVAAGRTEFASIFTKDKVGYIQEEALCEAITGSNNPTGCSMKSIANLTYGFQYAMVDVSGQLYEVYGYRKEYGSIKVAQETDGTPTAIPLAPATEYVEEIEVEICECVYADSFDKSSSEGVSADIAEPAYDMIWYPIAAGKRVSTYKGEAVSTYVNKAAFIKQKKVQPPEGTPMSECPEDWNQAT